MSTVRVMSACGLENEEKSQRSESMHAEIRRNDENTIQHLHRCGCEEEQLPTFPSRPAVVGREAVRTMRNVLTKTEIIEAKPSLVMEQTSP
jgi:ABC-type enterochelin transport system substrate-binding protein